MSDRPLNLRPSTRPRLVWWLVRTLVAGVVLALLGGPVWFFMHGAAAGWQEERPVVATVAADTRCRTGPPPGTPTTCEATWTLDGRTVQGEVSNRYGGPRPGPGDEIPARAAGDELALTGYARFLLAWALAAPYLCVAGVVVALVSAAGLRRFDPRWWTRRTDLI